MTEQTPPKKKHAEFSVTQKAILFDETQNKFLLFRIASSDGYFAKHFGLWDFVGGRVESGESLRGGLSREVVEEAGNEIRFDIDDVVCVEEVAYSDERKALAVGYLTFFGGGEVMLSKEHNEYCWMSAEEVAGNEECGEWVKRFVAAAEKRIKERGYLNDVKRVSADFENYKRRQKENQAEMAGFLTEKLVMDIVPVLDNFHAATVHVPEEAASSPWVVGIQYIEKQLADALASHGVAVIEPKVGDHFDPTTHEAIGNGESKHETRSTKHGDEKNENEERSHEQQTIAKVLQNGYRIGERVIRPAKVTVN